MRPFLSSIILPAIFVVSSVSAQTYAPLTVVEQIAGKGEQIVNKGNYQGSVYNYALVEWADCLNDSAFTRDVENLFLDFHNGKINGHGNFQNYEIGGVGAAYMDYKGLTPALSGIVGNNARKMFDTQARTSDGVMTVYGGTWTVPNDMLFIDAAFTVVPYFLYVGLKRSNQIYVNFAVSQALRSFDVLLDRTNGLLHQSRIRGVISKEHWCRANGWGAMALATLVRDLPIDHPRRKEVECVAKDFFTAVLACQDSDGMFHQELTRFDSFVETSGTGLLLYGIGTCIEKGLLPQTALDAFRKGLSSLLDYIWEDGSINNTSHGYMSEHGGDIFNCVSHNYIYNEPHAFGPVMLAFLKAHQLGIRQLTATHRRGIYANPAPLTEPQTFLRNYTQYKKTVAWENDKIAFRLFHETVQDKCGSGIDVIGKKVAYPIWNRFYENNRRGISYHVDHGEGCDFYDAGFARGCGGTALFDSRGFPCVAPPFREISILKNTKDEIVVTFFYNPITVDSRKYAENKTIRMKMGTQFVEVISVFEALDGSPVNGETLKLGVGLSRLGVGTVTKLNKNSALLLWETHRNNPSALGTAVIADSKLFIGYSRFGLDEYVMMNVPVGQPVRYFVGAAWAGAGKIMSMKDWKNLVVKQTVDY